MKMKNTMKKITVLLLVLSLLLPMAFAAYGPDDAPVTTSSTPAPSSSGGGGGGSSGGGGGSGCATNYSLINGTCVEDVTEEIVTQEVEEVVEEQIVEDTEELVETEELEVPNEFVENVKANLVKILIIGGAIIVLISMMVYLHLRG